MSNYWRQRYPSTTINIPSMFDSVCMILGLTGFAVLIVLLVWVTR